MAMKIMMRMCFISQGLHVCESCLGPGDVPCLGHDDCPPSLRS